jgi:ribokinase
MGAQGVAVAAPGVSTFIPAFKVQAVDTTAAGDAFNGGMAAALVEGHSLETAVVWGAAAGALSATKVGAQSSMPTRAQFEAFLKENAP